MSNKAKETLVPMDQILRLEPPESKRGLYVHAGRRNKVSLIWLLFSWNMRSRVFKIIPPPAERLWREEENSNFLGTSTNKITQRSIIVLWQKFFYTWRSLFSFQNHVTKGLFMCCKTLLIICRKKYQPLAGNLFIDLHKVSYMLLCI